MNREILNLSYYKGIDLYSDGDIEDEILEIVTEHEDFTSVLQHDDRWPILYHLSNIRENLLEWYDFQPSENLLEIGSGCGAISGLFCRKLKRVVGIELSKKRSTINATRNGKYKNLEIMVGNFEDITLEEKFDYVTLIGVLEYSPLYIANEDPFVSMLERTKNFLKDEGKLIIAIENKLGLKYLAGTPEDHTGKVFDGIENYQNISTVKTLSKIEIESLLHKVGFNKLTFYYPVPDYKMPRNVYSDEYPPKKGDLRNVTDAFDRNRYQTFNEEIVFDQLCEDGKFSYFSNSFLIIASK